MGAEERRRQRELEEARKAGLAAPAVDEEGRAINPHIPRYMSEAPWYASTEGPSLRHQRDWRERRDASAPDAPWYDRGAVAGRATKFRKGACANCGSMSHSARDCLERPRRRGAKLTGRDIAPDDVVQDVSLVGYDAKRDRWNGFGADDWERTVADSKERVAKLREERARQAMLEANEREEREKKEEEEERRQAGGAGPAAHPSAPAVSDRLDDSAAAEFGRVERRVRTVGGGASGTVRNLRIREDKAKYLLNLDPNSAYYDPKSRSMRENPFAPPEGAETGAAGAGAEATVLGASFRGDAALARSGGALEAAALAAYAERAAAQSGSADAVHPNAAPSAAERAFARAREAERREAEARARAAKEAYGDAAAGVADPLRGVRAEADYAEYDASGRLLRADAAAPAAGAGPGSAAAAAAALPRSRYEEDVFPGNHSSVWGSFWRDGRWGYACCHAMERGAYCAGEAGRTAADNAWKRQRALQTGERAEGGEGGDPAAAAARGRDAQAGGSSGEGRAAGEAATGEGAKRPEGGTGTSAARVPGTARAPAPGAAPSSSRPFLPPSGASAPDGSRASRPAPGPEGERWGRAGGEGGIEGVLGIVSGAGGPAGEAGEGLDQEKLREALAKARKRAREEKEEEEEREREREGEEGGGRRGRGGRLRGAAAAEAGLAGAAETGALTAEDAEAYRMLREREDDPMRNLNSAQGKGEGGYDYV